MDVNDEDNTVNGMEIEGVAPDEVNEEKYYISNDVFHDVVEELQPPIIDKPEAFLWMVVVRMKSITIHHKIYKTIECLH